MRVALLWHGPSSGQREALEGLKRGLKDRGVDARVVSEAREPRGRRGQLERGADRLLGRRGFTVPAAHLPVSVATLLRGGYDLVHAYTPSDAAAADLWKRSRHGATVFTFTEILDRAWLADRRLKVRWLSRAVQGSDAVLAVSGPVQVAIERWLAITAPVIELSDAEGHVRLYRRLLASRP